MRIRRARQILKGLADDTRLRIVNLLTAEELNVTELRRIIGVGQSNLSKHLARLRLTGVVSDKRRGVNVYYCLSRPERRTYERLVSAISTSLSGIETFKKDLAKLRQLNKKKRRRR